MDCIDTKTQFGPGGAQHICPGYVYGQRAPNVDQFCPQFELYSAEELRPETVESILEPPPCTSELHKRARNNITANTSLFSFDKLDLCVIETNARGSCTEYFYFHECVGRAKCLQYSGMNTNAFLGLM